ncbi:hypothetical protein MPLSOD_40649 [Mesorhizobium sp. SOD10]|nr:hypothetical protein MPLSOD_40649 [Mesorhizobium sp. SOD10]
MNALDQRTLVPEILDRLAADDPRALHSRRDLRRINVLMFQAPIMASLMRKFMAKAPCRILEIGAGDGTFMLKVARRMAKDWPEVELTMLDRVGLVTPELTADSPVWDGSSKRSPPMFSTGRRKRMAGPSM